MVNVFAELKRRPIYRIAAGYLVVAWILLQLFNNLVPMLKIPDWAGTLVLVLLIGGFPLVLVFAWVVELKPSAIGEGSAPKAAVAGPSLVAAHVAGPKSLAPLPAQDDRPPSIAPSHATSASTAHDGPSLVVLPFTNMSDEPGQDFFADGLTEDIITELSRFRHLFIISRMSAFAYRGKTVGAQQVARELNVQYVIEGSVRRQGSHVRICVQLIDGQADRHVWAERYDRKIDDIFALQDEITAAIVATLPGRVEAATGERVGRKPTENMNAYECVLAGKLLHHRSTRPDNERAQLLLNRAIALDPNYAHAHAWKACVLGQAWVNGYAADRDGAFKQIVGELRTAQQLDANDSDVHRILAAVYLLSGEHEKAVFHQQRALELNPNDDLVVVQQGEILTWLGQPEEGIRWIQKAMRLNPCHPERFWSHLGRAFFVARRYSEAISAFERITTPDQVHHSYLAACYAELGDDAAAHRHAAEVLRRDPEFSVATFIPTLHYKRQGDIEHHREALLKADLPATSAARTAAPATPAREMGCE